MWTDRKGNRAGYLLALLLALCALPQAWAQTGVTAHQTLVAQAQRWLKPAVAAAQATSEQPLHMSYRVGQPDRRLRLAACSRIEAYLPAGSRLWGRSRLGLRCTDGLARWNVFVPFTVTAMGLAWVVRRPVAAGSQLGTVDLMQAEVDWAADADPVLADPAQWLGQLATRPLVMGQVLRQRMVRAAQVFQPGAQVRVLAQGEGYEISADALAVTPGVIGQPARVRMQNGRVLSGRVLDARTVKLDI